MTRQSKGRSSLLEEPTESEALEHAAQFDNCVQLNKSDEAGILQWVLSTEDGYWVNAFPKKSEAISYARLYNLHVANA